jgi:ribosome-binding protein aMBF1 (putative translation factor)
MTMNPTKHYDYSNIHRQGLVLVWSIVPKKDASRIISLEVVQLLRQERIRRGISMNRLAEKSGLSQSMVSLLERGMRNPTLDTLLRMADALGLDLWRLIKRASTARSSAK